MYCPKCGTKQRNTVDFCSTCHELLILPDLDKTVLQEDIRKLHAEINQLTIHRLVLMAVGLTLVGGVPSWLWKEVERPDLFYVVIEIILLTALFIVYYLSFNVRNIQLKVVSYLSVRGLSSWEVHNKLFNDTFVLGLLEMPYYFIFHFLGLTVFLIVNVPNSFKCSLTTIVIYVGFIGFMCVTKCISRNIVKSCDRNWEYVLNGHKYYEGKTCLNICDKKIVESPARKWSESNDSQKALLGVSILGRYFLIKKNSK